MYGTKVPTKDLTDVYDQNCCKIHRQRTAEKREAYRYEWKSNGLEWVKGQPKPKLALAIF